MLLRPLQRPLAVADCLRPCRRVAGPLSLLNFLKNGVSVSCMRSSPFRLGNLESQPPGSLILALKVEQQVAAIVCSVGVKFRLASMRFLITVPLLVLAQLHAQSISKPRMAPFFDRIDESPAFYVECLNMSSAKVSSASPAWPLGTGSIRVDGTPIDFGNFIGPGLSTDVEPGQLWTGIIVLRQAQMNFFPAVNFGALVRAAPLYPLAAGKHAISVQCQGVWSDGFSFYWEPSAK
jgi:hypothetical protein